MGLGARVDRFVAESSKAAALYFATYASARLAWYIALFGLPGCS
jgi:hypothetical protein